MNEVTIRIISNIFIISGLILFISAVILAVLRHKERTSHIIFYDLKQKRGISAPKNRRTHERIQCSKEVRFSHPEAPYEEGTAKGRDIHPGGAGLLVPVNVKIKPGAKIDLELFLEGEDKPTGVMGKVVWTESLEDERMERLSLISEFFARRVGIKFIELHEENKQRMEIFIRGLSEKKK